ncbi:MAG: hypothetical protein KDF65_12065, partial [Anaerolineae bacterium]|nr:hypothetical protein [Anaerolineae bacterium]
PRALAGPEPMLETGCARPLSTAEAHACRRFEAQILASTVRLEWRQWKLDGDGGYAYVDGNIGFGTLKAGRYVVTHNHIGLPLAGPEAGSVIKISVATTTGSYIWHNMPSSAITIATEEAQTLVLDFGSQAEQELFGPHGVVSAEFKSWESLPLQAGLEVAQLDWDGTAVSIDWVPIDTVSLSEGLPRLELANFVGKGSSGGGVFWHGYHIANNWSRVTTYQKNSDQVLRQYSVVALNSPRVVTALP